MLPTIIDRQRTAERWGKSRDGHPLLLSKGMEHASAATTQPKMSEPLCATKEQITLGCPAMVLCAGPQLASLEELLVWTAMCEEIRQP